MQLVDTHCHIHEASRKTGGDALVRNKWAKAGITSPDGLIKNAHEAGGVTKLICVGCALRDSEMAVALADRSASCWASVGIHPHEAKNHQAEKTRAAFAELVNRPKVVAIGECGLDYFYTHSPKEEQLKILEFQLALAQKHDLPLILHIRDAFEDFWTLFDQFRGLKGAVHSFSSNVRHLDESLSRGLYVGLNGIMTFTKDEKQLEAARRVPLDRLLLETDAPFLTPTPYRGKICQPKHLRVTAEFLADLRGESLETLAAATTENAERLFKLEE